jgi:ParB family chromosome partitioning protein
MKALGRQEIDISKIDVSNRLRPINPAQVAILAQNIQETRLRTPIEVVLKGDRYKLIAGAHRVAAHQLLKRAKIVAELYEASNDEARLAEIDENLIRHELNPLDRAVFLAERKALWEKLHPEAKRGGDRRSKAAQDQTETISVWSFAKETADKIGLTDRAIRLAVSIATGLTRETRDAITGTYITNKQSDLLALSKLTDAQQKRAVAGLLGENPKWETVAKAVAAIRGREAKPVSNYDRLVTVWNKATAAERRQFRAYIEGPAMRRSAKEAA